MSVMPWSEARCQDNRVSSHEHERQVRVSMAPIRPLNGFALTDEAMGATLRISAGRGMGIDCDQCDDCA